MPRAISPSCAGPSRHRLIRNYEVLIANDGSTDNTVSVLAPFLQDQRFQLLGWEQNRGLNQAWAVLCSRARANIGAARVRMTCSIPLSWRGGWS